MPALRGLSRLLLLLAALVALSLTMGAAGATAQQEQPACSNGVDDDGDNSIDGDDAGCGDGSDDDETDSPYSGIVIQTIALPLVSLQATVAPGGAVNVSRLLIRAKRGSLVDITCVGKSCPFKTSRKRMITSRLRLDELQRKLRPPATLTLRIQRPDQLGKFVRYKIRRGKAPVREDDCLSQTTRVRVPCYED